MFGHLQDITAHKEAAEALIKNRDRLQALFDESPIPQIAVHAARREIVAINSSFTAVFGWSMSDGVDLFGWIAKLYPDPSYRERMVAAWLEFVGASGDRIRQPFENEIVTKAGERKLVRADMRWLSSDRQGEYCVSYEDITARKRAEIKSEQLLKSLKRTEELARIGGWELDLITRKLTWDHGEYLLHDLEPGDEAGLDEYQRNLELNPKLREAMAGVAKSGHKLDIEAQHATATGRKIWVHSRAEPIIRDGKVVGLVGHTQDITSRKEAEERLARAQKMEAVGQLTAGIAHDFNNLLSVISGNLELIGVKANGDPMLTQRLESALRAVERGADLTQHLLAYGRAQALNPKQHDLREKVEHTARLLKRTLPDNISVEVRAGNIPVGVLIDEAQLENALLNLGLNARDAMPEGGALMFSVGIKDFREIQDGLITPIEPGCYGVVTVRDTGTGMPPEVQAKAFEPFFTTKPVGQGGGLGLSMVYGFVRQSGGRLQLSSNVGKGTTFNLYFPLTEGKSEAAEASAERSAQLPTNVRRVLLVEDMAEVRLTIEQQLESLGFEVASAIDGQTAFALLDHAERPFDLMVTDLSLPGGLNGDQLAEKVARDYPGIKIVTMTGYNRERVIAGDVPTEPNHVHLRKPFKTRELEAALAPLFKVNR